MKKLISMLFMAVLAVLTMTGCDDEETVLQKYTVTFNSQGGSEVAPQAVYAGEKIVKPANPTKEKEYFVDWYKEAECTNVWDFENETVSQDITLYAKWTSIAYTVTFETNGGSAIEAQLVPEGTFATKPETVPTKEGNLFEGWYTEQTMTNLFDFYTPITKDITLYAKWMDISSITYDDLQQLFWKADRLASSIDNNYEYTAESLLALKEKVEEVRPTAENPSATQEEIAKAYQTLHTAMQALVELPYRQTVSLRIYPAPIEEGVIPVYISQGYFSLSISGLDSNENPATRPDIMLEFDGNELAKWGEYYYGGYHLFINSLKPNLKAGATIDIKVICNDNPSLSTTLKLKAIDAEEQKAMFISAVDALPQTITFDNSLEVIQTIKDIDNQYNQLNPDIQTNPDVQAACQKLSPIFTSMVDAIPQDVTFDNCLKVIKTADGIIDLFWRSIIIQELKTNDPDIETAYQKLENDIYPQTWRFTIYTAYKFDGNTCTVTTYYGSKETYEYKADGNFPYGTYTGQWDKSSNEDGDHYNQYKIELKSDNTYQMYHRYASSEAEKETAQWNNNNAGTYKLTGDQANGGSLILKAD